MQLSKVIRWWEQRKTRKSKILSLFQPEYVNAVMRFNGRMAGSIKCFVRIQSNEQSFIPVDFRTVELTFDSTKSSAAMDSRLKSKLFGQNINCLYNCISIGRKCFNHRDEFCTKTKSLQSHK